MLANLIVVVSWSIRVEVFGAWLLLSRCDIALSNVPYT